MSLTPDEAEELLDDLINQIYLDIILPGFMSLDEVLDAVELGLLRR